MSLIFYALLVSLFFYFTEYLCFEIAVNENERIIMSIMNRRMLTAVLMFLIIVIFPGSAMENTLEVKTPPKTQEYNVFLISRVRLSLEKIFRVEQHVKNVSIECKNLTNGDIPKLAVINRQLNMIEEMNKKNYNIDDALEDVVGRLEETFNKLKEAKCLD